MKVNYSIIIPTHNSSSFIIKLLDSIPDEDIEIIIVDDHSDDYADLQHAVEGHRLNNKIRLMQNTGVRSAGAARNIGLENSNGKWLVFADSDDYFTDNIRDIFVKYSNSSADVILFRIAGNHITQRADNLNGLLSSKNLDHIRYRHIVPWGKIIKKSVVDNFNIKFSEVRVSNDELFSAKVGLFSKSFLVEEQAGYFSYERMDSLTTQTHDTHMQDIRMNEILRKYELLNDNIGKKGLKRANLSILYNVKKAMSVGGIAYGLKWYSRLRHEGGRIRLWTVIEGKIKR